MHYKSRIPALYMTAHQGAKVADCVTCPRQGASTISLQQCFTLVMSVKVLNITSNFSQFPEGYDCYSSYPQEVELGAEDLRVEKKVQWPCAYVYPPCT